MPRPTANGGSTANTDPPVKPSSKRVATDSKINPELFAALDEQPTPLKSGTGIGGAGRTMLPTTLAALRYLREHVGKWCKVAEFDKKGGQPTARLTWAGYFVNDNGELVDPTEEQERTLKPDAYPVLMYINFFFG
jgi:hypothetical protein